MDTTGISSKIAATVQFVLISAFVVSLLLPFAGYFANSTETRVEANRHVIGEIRRGRLFSALVLYKNYFKMNFGFRQNLVNGHAIFKVKYLGVSSSRDVVLGRDGWLYFVPTIRLRKSAPMNNTLLESWKYNLETKSKTLGERGVAYIFMVAPDKISIYPEYLPPYCLKSLRESRLTQLIRYLNANSDFRILDFRPALLAGKQHALLYFKTDTHWNNRGAYLADTVLVKRLQTIFPDVQTLPESDFSVVEYKRRGDLLGMLGLLGNHVEDSQKMEPVAPPCAVGRTITINNVENTATTCADPRLPRALIIHDSFMVFMKPFIAEHFSYAEFIWRDNFSLSDIDRVQPDVVIQEIVERNLE